MQFQLNIDISADGVQRINELGQAVTIVRSVEGVHHGALPVAWITFSPLMRNHISWIDNYGLYATTQHLLAGATIDMSSIAQGTIQPGWVYTFQNGVFQGSQGTGNTYNISNQDNIFPASFGLAQQAIVNNQSIFSPLNCVPLAYNQDVSFAPFGAFSIFLSSYTDNGVVISQIAGNALVFVMGPRAPIANIGFNDATNTFYLHAIPES